MEVRQQWECGLNLYAYVGNNPTNLYDSEGLSNIIFKIFGEPHIIVDSSCSENDLFGFYYRPENGSINLRLTGSVSGVDGIYIPIGYSWDIIKIPDIGEIIISCKCGEIVIDYWYPTIALLPGKLRELIGVYGYTPGKYPNTHAMTPLGWQRYPLGFIK